MENKRKGIFNSLSKYLFIDTFKTILRRKGKFNSNIEDKDKTWSSIKNHYNSSSSGHDKIIVSNAYSNEEDYNFISKPIARAIFHGVLIKEIKGFNLVGMKKGIQKAAEIVLNELSRISIPVKEKIEIDRVASIFCDNDNESAELVVEALKKTGNEGIIDVLESKNLKSCIETYGFIKFDDGVISPHFISKPESMETIFENVSIMIFNKKISSIKILLPVFEKSREMCKPLLVIANDVKSDVLASIIMYKIEKSLKITLVKAPFSGNNRKVLLEDIAALTGADIISGEYDEPLLDKIINCLGEAAKVIINNRSTTIIGTKGENKKTDVLIRQIGRLIKNTTDFHDFDLQQERISRLTKFSAVIYAGAITEIEMKVKKQLIEKAVRYTRMAIEEGVVPGDGVAYLRCLPALNSIKSGNKPEAAGFDILVKALEEPLKKIVDNAGGDSSFVISRIKRNKNNNFGFISTSMKYGDMVEAGLVKPTRIYRLALQKAAKTANLFLDKKI